MEGGRGTWGKGKEIGIGLGWAGMTWGRERIRSWIQVLEGLDVGGMAGG